ncbi:MAG TPA: AAA family ATPase, partial [Gemmataceae bacterium]
MLRRLELVGFKSFADKTRFDFPPGITAVVGPNGSGKSNIVDAVRWILGEQSAKSLRGGEMADVIFNGSATRKSLGMAEVTLTFDNARRALAADADEVQFTRRVYRDGQGEYLINNQPARLKDIKEMFLGSGAGTSAYCIIEQGRVDALLQASTRDRRVIFEEAAGISRFRAKKLESARKLERVAQNLLRLRDILAEVDKQLRKVRLEASKAQKYQEFTRRLKDLRVGLALREYHELTGRLTAERAALEELRARLSDAAAQAQEWDAQSRELEGRLAATEEALREGEALLAEARQRIAAQRSAWVHEGQRAAELETELAAARRRRAALGYQIRDLLAEADRARASAGEVAQQVRAQEETAAALEAALAEASGELRRLREEVEAARAGHMDAVRQEALLKNEAGNARRLLDELAAKRDRAARRIEQTHGELESLALVLRDLTQTGEDLRNRLLGTRQALAERTKLRAELRRQADGVQQFLTDLHIQRGALQSRIAVLEELENSQEGIGTGVREVMAILHAERARPAAGGEPRLGDVVLGLLADFLTVPPEHAPLIDLALGEELAQCFLVTEPDRLDDLLRRRGGTFPGRVRFLPLSRGRPFLPGPMPEAFAEYPTADRLVACAEPRLADLPARLLGGTLLVPDLPAARRLAAQAPPGSPYRFLTPRGELLESDGTLTVGAHRGEGGIVSRKSELRELRREALALDERVGRLEADLLRLREQAEALEVPIRSLEEALAALTAEAGDLSTQTALHRNRHEDLCAELEQGEADLAALEQELARQREELARLEAQA